MHDALTLEHRGIPCALICTDTFVNTADIMAENLGVKGYPYAVVEHPIGRLDSDRLTDRIEQAVSDCMKLLKEDIRIQNHHSTSLRQID